MRIPCKHTYTLSENASADTGSRILGTVSNLFSILIFVSWFRIVDRTIVKDRSMYITTARGSIKLHNVRVAGFNSAMTPNDTRGWD